MLTVNSPELAYSFNATNELCVELRHFLLRVHSNVNCCLSIVMVCSTSNMVWLSKTSFPWEILFNVYAVGGCNKKINVDGWQYEL